MKELLLRYSRGRIVLLFFLITTAVYAFMLTVTLPNLIRFSNGLQPLDMLPTGYSHAYVQRLMNALGNDGRHYYLTVQLPVDFLYPALFATTYSLLFAYLLKRMGKAATPFFYISFLPIVAGIFDYLENVGIIYLIKSYPNIDTAATAATSIFSVIKSTATSVYFVCLLILLVYFVIYKIRAAKSQSHNL